LFDYILPISVSSSTPVKVSSAEETFSLQADALAPSFKLSNNSMVAKQYEYIDIPLRYKAAPCKKPNIDNLPNGLELRGSCGEGFVLSGNIMADVGDYIIDLTGKNAGGQAKTSLNLQVLPYNTPDESSNSVKSADLQMISKPQSVNPKTQNQIDQNNSIVENPWASSLVLLTFSLLFILLLVLATVYFVRRRFLTGSKKILSESDINQDGGV
jgi:hypothetical protein